MLISTMIISNLFCAVTKPGKRRLLFVFLFFLCSLSHSQDYHQYFANKAIADSLIRLGRYEDALENIKLCVAMPEMSTVTDEFYLGYSFFKVGNIDSAAFYLLKALNEGFFFQKMEYVNYWKEKGVFDKFETYKLLEPVEELLTKNTLAYLNAPPLDSVLANELIAARELDQKYRRIHAVDSLWAKQMILDKQNQEFLRKIIQRDGWPGKKMVGYHGSNSAFLIAQHSDMDTTFQRECLNHIRKAFYKHDVNSADYAYIIDRIRINSNRPQLFGTQFYSVVEDGKKTLKLKPVEDEKHLNLRRRLFGLPPADQYLLNSQQRLLK
jgi:tetratricopeptide (TPR) repeat protein